MHNKNESDDKQKQKAKNSKKDKAMRHSKDIKNK